jgi:flagellar protein FliO/FliZ
MSFVDLIRWFASLAITLGLFGLAVWAFRKWGPDVFKKMPTVRGPRRLAVVESLMIDPQRRLVLISVDGQEKLILLGEGRLLTSHDRGVETVR